MYRHNEADDRLNREVILRSVANLREKSASRYGLRNKVPVSYSNLIGGTILYERRALLGYNLDPLTEENAVLFTGQCLIKDNEDLECPITLEDAAECERLKELVQRHPMPVVCMYPDSTYIEFIKGWSGEHVTEEMVNDATEKYIIFRRRILPGIIHYRTSELEEEVKAVINHLEIGNLQRQVRRIYGGRTLGHDDAHPLQKTVLEYGIKEIALPLIAGYGDRDIVVFAEPDEICSVKAAELVRGELHMNNQIGLIGQLPLPSLGFPLRGKIRMYSANRDDRIHLNENDAEIKTKLESDPLFSLLVLQLSPLTTRDQLEYIMGSRDRKIGIDLLMEQIKLFREYASD